MAIISEYSTDTIAFHHRTDNRVTKDYSLHCHNSYEIYYFIQGDVSYLVEGKRYTPTPYSLLMLSPNSFHGIKIETNTTYERFCLHFIPETIPVENRNILLNTFHQNNSVLDIYYQNISDYDLCGYFTDLENCMSMPSDMQNMAVQAVLQVLLIKILNMTRTLKNFSVYECASEIIFNVITYLNNHLIESITLDDLSKRFYISKHHLNTLFRKATGTTVHDYLVYKRVVTARQLILKGKSANFAALNTGFKDYSVFFRAFKKFIGHSPSDDINNNINRINLDDML